MEGILQNVKSSDGSRATTGLLVQQALRAKKIYVFGELLAQPQVQKMKSAPEYELLEIFAFGTYGAYRAKQAWFEAQLGQALTPVQLAKLRQLTVLSLAQQSKQLRYADVGEATGLSSVREVEDLVISCVYDGLLKATCNPQLACFVVQWSAGRDARGEADLQQVVAKLDLWLANSGDLVQRIDSAVSKYRADQAEEKQFHELVKQEAEARRADMMREVPAAAVAAEDSGGKRGGAQGFISGLMGVARRH